MQPPWITSNTSSTLPEQWSRRKSTFPKANCFMHINSKHCSCWFNLSLNDSSIMDLEEARDALMGEVHKGQSDSKKYDLNVSFLYSMLMFWPTSLVAQKLLCWYWWPRRRTRQTAQVHLRESATCCEYTEQLHAACDSASHNCQRREVSIDIW